MRLSRINAHHLRIPFRVPFAHGITARSHTDTVILELISNDGSTGFGEILPRPYLTGETIASVLRLHIPAVAQRWLGSTLDDAEEIVARLQQERIRAGRALATLAGWELAILDLAGKALCFSAGDVLGPVMTTGLPSGCVIDFSIPTERLERHCTLLRLKNQRHVKVKVGRCDDVRRLEIVAQVFGATFPIRVDANGIWSREDAIAALRQFRRFNVCSVEQPVHAADIEGMRIVSKAAGLPVVADESVCTLEDAQRLIQARAATAFNIRIAKCGGLMASRTLTFTAQEAGIYCQLGTLVGETGILSSAAELFSHHVNAFSFLEGKSQNKYLLIHDIVEPITTAEGAASRGLGVRLIGSSLSQWAVCPPLAFTASQGAIA